MKHKGLIIILILVVILLLNAVYILDERNQVIITQFGEPVGESISDAGLHFKIPFIQKVHFFEKRILEWDGDPKQIPTADKRYIWLDSYARWQIVDPLKFYQTTRSETFAHSRLDDIVSGTTRDVVSSYKLIEIVRNSNRELQFTSEFEDSSDVEIEDIVNIETGREKIEDEIFATSSKQILDYGIKLIDLKIKRLNYNDEVREKVYARMISERKKIAAKYRSAGEGEAAEIRGKRKRELDEIESLAFKTAQQIIGKADASALKTYADAYEDGAEFYEFSKTLETYKNTIQKKGTLIMTTDSDYFKYLKTSD